jgi:hypothetical protein
MWLELHHRVLHRKRVRCVAVYRYVRSDQERPNYEGRNRLRQSRDWRDYHKFSERGYMEGAMEDTIVNQLRAYGMSVQDNFSAAPTLIATEGYELVLLLGVLRGLQRKMNYRRAPISHCHQSMNGIPRTFAFQKRRVLWRRKFHDQSEVFGLKEMTTIPTKAMMEMILQNYHC